MSPCRLLEMAWASSESWALYRSSCRRVASWNWPEAVIDGLNLIQKKIRAGVSPAYDQEKSKA